MGFFCLIIFFTNINLKHTHIHPHTHWSSQVSMGLPAGKWSATWLSPIQWRIVLLLHCGPRCFCWHAKSVVTGWSYAGVTPWHLLGEPENLMLTDQEHCTQCVCVCVCVCVCTCACVNKHCSGMIWAAKMETVYVDIQFVSDISSMTVSFMAVGSKWIIHLCYSRSFQTQIRFQLYLNCASVISLLQGVKRCILDATISKKIFFKCVCLYINSMLIGKS